MGGQGQTVESSRAKALESLLAFWAQAGVDASYTDAPVNRQAEQPRPRPAAVPAPSAPAAVRNAPPDADITAAVERAKALAAGAETLAELAADFDLGRFSSSAARFDMQQLLALNRRILHVRAFADVAARLPDGATEAFWLAVRGNLDLLNEARGWWDVVAGDIVPPVIENEGEFLRQASALLPAEPWGPATWPDWTAALKAASARSGKALFMPLRLALTGEDYGPEMKALLPLMGRARVLERLRVAAR